MPQERVIVGVFGAAHGVRGEIRVKSFTADPVALARYGPLSDKTGTRQFTIASARPVRDDLLVVRVAGVGDRTAAEALNGIELFVPRDRLPRPTRTNSTTPTWSGSRRNWPTAPSWGG